LAMKCIAHGKDAEAERLLRRCLCAATGPLDRRLTRKTIIEGDLKFHTILAELLERKGTEEALAEARTLRDEVEQKMTRHEERRIAALEETRAEAAEAVRQWREERIKAKNQERGAKGRGGKKKGKGKKKGRRGKTKAKGASSAALPAIEGKAPHEPAGGGGGGGGGSSGGGGCSCRG
jgi:hypothetical protein